MNEVHCTPLQLREVFHLEFLRRFGKRAQAGHYALKGGVNLRFFFNSPRYSEDMDLDAVNIRVGTLKDHVMKILGAVSFQDALKPFGVEKIISPDISKAKQTETTQRFKIHLITAAGEDLFTKVEFSRRGFKEEVEVRAVPDAFLRAYKMPPTLVPHYGIRSAVIQKIEALAGRSVIQARDVFDLYILSSQYGTSGCPPTQKSINSKVADKRLIAKAQDNALEIGFGQFRDTVVSYLASEDQAAYRSPALWDEIKLKVAHFIDETAKIQSL